MPMRITPRLTALAKALQTGDQDAASIIVRFEFAANSKWRGTPSLVDRYQSAFANKPRPRLREVIDFLQHDEKLSDAWWKHFANNPRIRYIPAQQTMQPVTSASKWNIPAITSVGGLASWLRLNLEELEWFADLKRINRKTTQPELNHYNYAFVTKRSGGLRLIESPKQRLKILQRQILSEILDRMPTHPAAHGFVRGRSIRTFAQPHAGKVAVLRMDIDNFFPGISAGRVAALFRTAGYPEPVADRIASLCTNAAPHALWQTQCQQMTWEELVALRSIYSRPHLPQGAPTSPALANLCAYRLDCRLHGLAQFADAIYTRYADDLAFSGGEDFRSRGELFSKSVGAILLEEGFKAHYRKTRIMRQSTRQQLTGLVVNQHLNIKRSEFDRLKATLTNCIRFGPESQNRECVPDFRAHLTGRVAFVQSINPLRGSKLQALLEQIRW